MSLGRNPKQLKLLCKESLPPMFTIRKATEREILFLKPIPFNRLYSQCVAGGYAAYVEGTTTTYGDIDVFKNDGANMPQNRNSYNGMSSIRNIKQFNHYQSMSMLFDGWLTPDPLKNNIEFAKYVINGFDLKESKVAYFQNDTYYYIRQNYEYCKRDICRLRPDRMFKWNKRMKTPNSLKYLSLAHVKKNYDPSDFKSFINKIDITFYFCLFFSSAFFASAFLADLKTLVIGILLTVLPVCCGIVTVAPTLIHGRPNIFLLFKNPVICVPVSGLPTTAPKFP